MKVCTICKIERPVEEFTVRKASVDGLSYDCRSCRHSYNQEYYRQKGQEIKQKQRSRTPEERKIHNAKKREYRKNHPEMFRRIDLKCRYGIEEVPEYCEVCGKHESENTHGRIFVDHDHITGQVRGFLCHGCNSALGNIKDDPRILEKLAQYLYKWKESK